MAQLRDVAKETEAESLSGYSTMHKEELLGALCTALGVEAHVHHEVVGIDKSAIKGQIKALKAERQSALDSGSASDTPTQEVSAQGNCLGRAISQSLIEIVEVPSISRSSHSETASQTRLHRAASP